MPDPGPLRAATRAAPHSDAAHKTRLAALDALRGTAIVLVVGTHALSYVRIPDPGLREALAFWIQAPCVVAFFFADGFLLAARGLPPLRRSAQRLLIPWLLFSVLYGALRAAYESSLPPAQWVVRGHAPAELLAGLWRSEWSGQLYFLPALFLLRAAAPLVAACVRAGAWACWSAFALAALASPALLMPRWAALFPGPGLEPVLHALWGFPFVLLGAAAAGLAPRLPRGPALPVALTVATLTARAYAPGFPTLAQYLYLAALFVTFWCLELRKIWTALGRRTMGLFLLHQPLAIGVCLRLLAPRLPDPLSLLAAIWTGGLALALLGTLLLERIPYGGVLLGERLPVRAGGAVG